MRPETLERWKNRVGPLAAHPESEAMRNVTLLTLCALGALLGVQAVACSQPDVTAFNGSGAQQAASGDDDDDDSAPAAKKATTAKKKTTTTTPTSDTTTTPSSKKTTTTSSSSSSGAATPTTGTSATTPQACFTHCVSPVPEAAALDKCANACSDSDTNCLSDCYDSSGCGDNPQCDQAVDQCSTKCDK
jgi:hypothetical protein